MTGFPHGGALDRAISEFGGTKADWLDLSTGINPNPYPVPDIPNGVWHRLPDEGLMEDCLASAKNYYGVPHNASIVAAPGTQSIIQILPRILPVAKLGIVSPTYNEYERCYRDAGNEIASSASFEDAVLKSRLVVAGNPNNPDGKVLDRQTLNDANLKGLKVIVDEAFADVMPDTSVVDQAGKPDLLVLKSFGKFFGLAGMRLGFAIGERNLVEEIRKALGPWAVSGPALFVGAKAMRDLDWVNEARSRLSGKRGCVETLLDRYGFSIIGATDLFVTVSHKDSKTISKSLAQNRILVRTFDYAPMWIRFGLPRSHADFDRLEKALAQAT